MLPRQQRQGRLLLPNTRCAAKSESASFVVARSSTMWFSWGLCSLRGSVRRPPHARGPAPAEDVMARRRGSLPCRSRHHARSGASGPVHRRCSRLRGLLLSLPWHAYVEVTSSTNHDSPRETLRQSTPARRCLLCAMLPCARVVPLVRQHSPARCLLCPCAKYRE